MPYFYFGDDDQLHYVKNLYELPDDLFSDTQPIEPIAPGDDGDWTLDNALLALDEENSDE